MEYDSYLSLKKDRGDLTVEDSIKASTLWSTNEGLTLTIVESKSETGATESSLLRL